MKKLFLALIMLCASLVADAQTYSRYDVNHDGTVSVADLSVLASYILGNINYPVTEITLSKTNATLFIGDTLQLSATVLPVDADDASVTWVSDDISIATVMNGMVLAVGEGNANITCKANDGSGIIATCKVTVSQDTPTSKNRVVLMYMIAENNLNNPGYDFYATDSAEIAIGAKALKDNEKLLAFIARNNAMPKIVLFTNKGPQTVKTFNERFYCTDPDKMKEVMQWVVSNYPADSYGLTFWGHGTSWLFDNDGSERYTQARKRALGYDTSAQSSFPHWINIPDLAKAIASAMPHLDFIFFDCCNMQSVEVAYELRNTTDYLIGSPAEIPGSGAPYNAIVKDFFLDKDKVGENLICDYVEYTDFTRLENIDFKKVAGLPMSVIRTDALDNLALATKFALGRFMKNKPESANVANCIFYMRDFKHYNNQPCLYDMRNVMRANISPDGFTEEDFKQWDAALSEAVYRPHIARVEGKSDWNSDFIRYSDFISWQYTDENYGGISMFVPLEGYGEDGPIYSFSSSNQYYHSPNNLIHKMQWYNAVEWFRYGW